MEKTTVFREMKDIPEQFTISPVKQQEYLIDGEIFYWKGEFIEVVSPVCLKEGDAVKPAVIGRYPSLTAEESLKALEAACRAFDSGTGKWPMMGVQERIGCVKDFANLMKEQREEIVNLLMWEIGKNLPDSRKEFDRTVEYIIATIDALKNLDRASSRFEMDGGIIAQIRRAPLGVVLCMGPFNYPLNETFTTLIPALIMGNTVVIKPAKHGVLLLRPLLKAFQTCFPRGVVNTIYGEGKTIIGPLMESGKVDVLAFIGSKRVSNILEKQHPMPNRLTTVLGLNAKNPGIILEDADLDVTVSECIRGSLSFNGQRCTALKILFVQEKIADEFAKRFSDGVSSLKGGLPWDEDVKITPLPEEGKTGHMLSYIEDAIANGAKVINEGGGVVDETFITPAVVYPVNAKMKLYNEEQFGPVVPIVPFKDLSEPIKYIENSCYGQQVSLFGKNPAELARLIDQLVNQVCRVNINCQCQRGPDSFPFTGRKDSAEGTLSVTDALKVFSIRTLVAAKESDLNKRIINEIVKERKSGFLSTDFIL
ncbi:MAG: NADP-dependent glyceraldehyde-3-phosphate dehydrogenase [Spirochaetales bacterium]|nr:NADP-dependent glyceraldehyde-3-phosphate dehydrogenase [Spirochaetales bacterium]